eukprot:CAMPEP_0195519068 /NCGR_PEP_ID=MMETSP0794_2-20130614/14307_1 /TAXON_ID=515487 /ORGANISM="Stephanopyxis turris, Strain CCMP 815" /LENGTH=235 /DNA_ID=CAMNT_0040648163 /DNA_START=40 /DNA_END=747 /DNA_ORIENTATION=+
MKFTAAILAGLALTASAQEDPCKDKHKTESACDKDTTTGGGCTWCKCAALPSACWTKENAAKLPSGVYQCDSTDLLEVPEIEILENQICDGTNYKCNATSGNITVHEVLFSSSDGTWHENATATLNMTGQLVGDIDINAGTTHFKIWEGGVEHFRYNGALDYFHCGPAPAGCDKTKPLSLFIDDPNNTTSTVHVEVSFPLPSKLASGIFTIDFYGEDEYHEPYDFTVNLAYHYDH